MTMTLWEAMEAGGWSYDRRTNCYRKGAAVVSYMQAEQAFRDALNGIDRSQLLPANENDGGDDAT